MLKSEIDTPALVVDLTAMESNLRRMAAFFADGPTRLRPHYKNHKSPALARRQMALGAIGMTCATVGEAEALGRAGIASILLANEVADSGKIARCLRLSEQTDLIVAVDSERIVAALAAAASRQNRPSVVVDVDTGMGRCGVPQGEPAAALAQFAVEKGLHFRGLTGYEGHCVRLAPGPEKERAIRESMRKLADTAELIRSRGIPVEIVSAGGTGTYSISGRLPGITEIQAGSYPFMDTDYATVCRDFEMSLSVLTTVISRTGNQRIVLDCGLKSLSGERGLPTLKNVDGARLRRLNAEHAIVDILDPALPVQVGDRLEIWAHYSDATVNLHRRIYGLRGDQVEETFILES